MTHHFRWNDCTEFHSNGSIFGELFIHIFREREKFICIKSDERGIQEEMTDPKLAELPIEKEYSGLLIFLLFLMRCPL